MADKVHITKRGFQALGWEADVEQHLEQTISTALHVLRCACHIESGVTLSDIFQAVEQDRELVRFRKEWSWCNVEAFRAEIHKDHKRLSVPPVARHQPPPPVPIQGSAGSVPNWNSGHLHLLRGEAGLRTIGGRKSRAP